MTVTRLNFNTKWDECERLIAVFLKRWMKPVVRLLGLLSGMAVLESSKEVDMLVTEGTKITPETLCFRQWRPWMHSLCEASLLGYRWIALKGLLIHLWLLRMLRAIRDLCGGFVRLNCSLDDMYFFKNLRIQVEKGPLNKIPRVILVEDHGFRFLVEIVEVSTFRPKPL